jgi:hypothetical protein
VEGRGAGLDLDVLLGRPQLQRHVAPRQSANYVDEQAGGQHHRAGAQHLALQGYPQTDLHVGGAQLHGSVFCHDVYARERLDGTASGGRAGDRLQLCEEDVAPG